MLIIHELQTTSVHKNAKIQKYVVGASMWLWLMWDREYQMRHQLWHDKGRQKKPYKLDVYKQSFLLSLKQRRAHECLKSAMLSFLGSNKWVQLIQSATATKYNKWERWLTPSGKITCALFSNQTPRASAIFQSAWPRRTCPFLMRPTRRVCPQDSSCQSETFEPAWALVSSTHWLAR